ncbi:hypothetical protein BDW22DRAFT_1261658 [Trametopsis cervina]|nr:hypothetical protein BDW22DRAFT_1261658 [Trametopsis cervina]
MTHKRPHTDLLDVVPTSENNSAGLCSADDVDLALSRIAEMTRKLRYARNAFAPVNRLPPELLSTIFLYLHDHDAGTFSSTSIRSWYKVTHVCQFWRHVALGCSILWTQLDPFGHEKWVEEMLTRSNTAGLIVKVSVSRASTRTLDSLRNIFTHLGRMKVLHLSLDRKTMNAILPPSAAADLEMPRLKSLAISNIHCLNEVINIPTTLFSGGAPQLEHLDIQHCSIPWNMPLLLTCPRLKTLHLETSQGGPPTAAELYSILSAMPLLADLRLIGVLSAAPTPVPQSVALPHLHTLALCGAATELASFLKNVQLPPRVSTSMVCHTPSDADELVVLTAALEPFFTHEDSLTPRGIYISSASSRIRLYTSSQDGLPKRIPTWAVFGDEGSLVLSLTTDFSNMNHARRLLVTLTQGLSLKNITAMSAEDDRSLFDSTTFSAVVQTMPNLRTLQTCQEAGFHVTEVLSAGPDPPTVGELSAVPVPKLDRLVMESVDMGWVADHANLLNRLQEMQLLRSNRGYPISELSIVNCYEITDAEVKILCHLFVDVQWDGIQMCWSDDESANDDEEAANWEMWEMWEGAGMGWHS